MPIRFLCHQCHAKMKVPDGTEGKRVRCPRCGSTQQVPRLAAALAATPPASPKPGHEADPAPVAATPPVAAPIAKPAPKPRAPEGVVIQVTAPLLPPEPVESHEETDGGDALAALAAASSGSPPVEDSIVDTTRDDVPGFSITEPESEPVATTERVRDPEPDPPPMLPPLAVDSPAQLAALMPEPIARPKKKPKPALALTEAEPPMPFITPVENAPEPAMPEPAPAEQSMLEEPGPVAALATAAVTAVTPHRHPAGRAPQYLGLLTTMWLLRLAAAGLLFADVKAALLVMRYRESALEAVLALIVGLAVVGLVWLAGEAAQALRDIARNSFR